MKNLLTSLAICGTVGCTQQSDASKPMDSGGITPIDTSTGDDSGESPSGTVDLVVAEGWLEADLSTDPTPAHQPSSISCDSSGIRPEAGVLEMQTDDCNYVLIEQPIRESVRMGDTLDLLVYHSALSASEEAEAHILITLDGTTLWEHTVAIPAASEVHSTAIEATADWPAGTPVVVHLHNHGGNSYKLAHLRRE